MSHHDVGVMRVRRDVGFTLVEVMLAVCVLALGTVMIQQGFLKAASLFHEAAHRLAAETWMQTKLASVKERMVYAESPSFENESGTFEVNGRPFQWEVGIDSAPGGKELYSAVIRVSWQESGGERLLAKEALIELRDKLQ